MNTLLNDETGEEEKPWSEEVQRMKILSVLDKYEEMVKGRRKELISLKEMGAMTVAKRSEAGGKRVMCGSTERKNKALCGHRKAPKLWHQHVVSILESLSYHPRLTDPSCLRNDELNTNIFGHVDDALFFGPRIEVLHLVELLSKHILMRIVGRMEKLGDKVFFLGRVIERTARGYSVEANPKCIRDVIAVLGLEDSRPVSTPSVKRTPTTESLGELETEW